MKAQFQQLAGLQTKVCEEYSRLLNYVGELISSNQWQGPDAVVTSDWIREEISTIDVLRLNLNNSFPS